PWLARCEGIERPISPKVHATGIFSPGGPNPVDRFLIVARSCDLLSFLGYWIARRPSTTEKTGDEISLLCTARAAPIDPRSRWHAGRGAGRWRRPSDPIKRSRLVLPRSFGGDPGHDDVSILPTLGWQGEAAQAGPGGGGLAAGF